LERFETAFQRFEMSIFFFLAQAFPPPLKGQGCVIIGKALDETVTPPVSRAPTCCFCSAFEFAVVLS
jgi:hypothetical protein